MNDFFKKNRFIIATFLIILAVSTFIMLMERLQAVNKPEEVILSVQENKSDSEEKEKAMIKIDIQGEVKNPGVYELEDGAIVDDAIAIAGGFTQLADLDYVSRKINKAKRLKDEEKIYIPAQGEMEQADVDESIFTEENKVKVNINTATLEELDSLPKIGPSYAQKIIDGRPYTKIDEVKKVKGIGDSIFEEIKDLITV